jgi:hypothetical protein
MFRLAFCTSTTWTLWRVATVLLYRSFCSLRGLTRPAQVKQQDLFSFFGSGQNMQISGWNKAYDVMKDLGLSQADVRNRNRRNRNYCRSGNWNRNLITDLSGTGTVKIGSYGYATLEPGKIR